jgi:hypothetical protein
MTPTYEGPQKVWESARQRVYFGSLIHFMRSLCQGRLHEEGFLILHQVKKINTEKERVKAIYNPSIAGTSGISSDSIRFYRKILREPDYFIRTLNNYDTLLTINADGTRSFYFAGAFTIAHVQLGVSHPSSSIELISPVSLHIEENGSYSPQQNLLLKGVWARTETVANFLPSDYMPPPSKNKHFSSSLAQDAGANPK